MSSFSWHPDEDPPEIESHSRAKLEVLRSYLRAYFDKLNKSPLRDGFKLDLIDGFAGGGLFRNHGDPVPGSPLIMLEEAVSAEQRINAQRSKPLRFDCKFYFVDKEKARIDHLRKMLREAGFKRDDNKIVLRANLFGFN